MSSLNSDINQRIAARIRELRGEHELSLDALARKSGVSRSMISVVERGGTSPTAVLLEKLAVALGVTLAALFEAPKGSPLAEGPIARRAEQPEWQDPESGYVRRNVSPPDKRQPMQIVEVLFPGGARVAFDTGPRFARVYQQIWLLEGTMEITYAKERFRLDEGDCLAMELAGPIIFRNPTRKMARYAVVLVNESPVRRTKG